MDRSGQVPQLFQVGFLAGEEDVTIALKIPVSYTHLKIVTTVRGNSLKGLISIDSPLGKALLGHKAGETVYVKVDERFGYEVEIRSIDTTTEGEEETLRSF